MGSTDIPSCQQQPFRFVRKQRSIRNIIRLNPFRCSGLMKFPTGSLSASGWIMNVDSEQRPADNRVFPTRSGKAVRFFQPFQTMKTPGLPDTDHCRHGSYPGISVSRQIAFQEIKDPKRLLPSLNLGKRQILRQSSVPIIDLSRIDTIFIRRKIPVQTDHSDRLRQFPTPPSFHHNLLPAPVSNTEQPGTFFRTAFNPPGRINSSDIEHNTQRLNISIFRPAVIKRNPGSKRHSAVSRGINDKRRGKNADTFPAESRNALNPPITNPRLKHSRMKQNRHPQSSQQIKKTEIPLHKINGTPSGLLQNPVRNTALRPSHNRPDKCMNPHTAKPSVTFQKQDFRSAFRRRTGGSDPCGTTAADNDIIIHNRTPFVERSVQLPYRQLTDL